MPNSIPYAATLILSVFRAARRDGVARWFRRQATALKASAFVVALLAAFPVQSEVYTMTGRVTMAPVVTGPSGYLAALNTGARGHRFEVIRLGGGHVALQSMGPGSGYLRAGFTEWNYLSIAPGAIDDTARFLLERSGEQASLRSVSTGHYVGYNLRSGRLRASFPVPEASTVWLMQRVNIVTGDAEDDRGFLGQRWPVQAFRDAQGRWRTPTPQQAARMLITPRRSDGYRVQIDTLCDSFDSALQIQPPHIRFISFQNTRAYCSESDRNLSQAYLDMLANARRFQIEARRVTLLNEQGVAIGIFER